ncbi:hypothetical protein PMZ80_002972 [Knufia obscura]|uniref:Uncharacterized protein n=1 Tax=Knufia obscura TaxID=1635080 RepID=A0ABR0RYV2_9EURO|nr:hypothetical protein PMZ80_002972 [Knufia obscura]
MSRPSLPSSNSNPPPAQLRNDPNAMDPPPPPAYDTLSLAPPSISADAALAPSSQQTSSPSESHTPQPQPHAKKSLKDRWRDLKDEDERRRSERITHVSADEADRLTGLDRHRAEEERKSAVAERPRGMKALVGFLTLS